MNDHFKKMLEEKPKPSDCPYCGKKVTSTLEGRFREYKNGGGTREYLIKCACDDLESHPRFGVRKYWKPSVVLEKNLSSTCRIWECTAEEVLEVLECISISAWNEYVDRWKTNMTKKRAVTRKEFTFALLEHVDIVKWRNDRDDDPYEIARNLYGDYDV